MKEVRQAAQLQRLVFHRGAIATRTARAQVRPAGRGALRSSCRQSRLWARAWTRRETRSPALVKIAPKLANGRFVRAAAEGRRRRGRARAALHHDSRVLRARRLERVPFVVYLNDMQWAGRGPAEMFSFLAQRACDDEASRSTASAWRSSAAIGATRSKAACSPHAAETLRSRGMAIGVELTPLDAGPRGGRSCARCSASTTSRRRSSRVWPTRRSATRSSCKR